ncbi:MAG: sugar phosphate isomerase/epimerase [bacterium]|nr:sugar phosphate isomerase/epimerase [bacterium]
MSKIKFAINQATTMESNFEEDIKAYSSAGFNSVEIWFDKLKVYIEKNGLAETKKLLKECRISPVGMCAQGDLMLTSGNRRKEVIKEFTEKLEICRYLEIPTLVVPTDFPDKVKEDDYGRCIPNIQKAGDIAERYGVALAIEFIAGARFLGSLSTAIEIVKKVDKKNVGILFDTFHFYSGISKFEDMDGLTKENLFFVHINDVMGKPREVLTDGDRVFPGDGVLPLKKIIKKIIETGYTGYYSLELFNKALWQKDAGDVAKKGYEALHKFLKEL